MSYLLLGGNEYRSKQIPYQESGAHMIKNHFFFYTDKLKETEILVDSVILGKTECSTQLGNKMIFPSCGLY